MSIVTSRERLEDRKFEAQTNLHPVGGARTQGRQEGLLAS